MGENGSHDHAASAGGRGAAGRGPSPGRVVVAALRDWELRWQFSRSSGPGGQGVNTADSRVQLRWAPAASPALSGDRRERALARLAGRLVDGDLIIAASRFRSQLRNRDDAVERLVQILDEALAPPPPKRRPTRPSRGSVERRVAGKKRRGEVKRLRRDLGD